MNPQRWALDAMDRSVRAMHHSTNELELCQSCCEAITNGSVYQLAWIGFAEHDEKKNINIVAKSGQHLSYLDGIQVSWADEPNGRGPTGSAIKSGKSQIITNIFETPACQPWWDRVLRTDFKSIIAIPLFSGSTCFGVLTVYSDQPNDFDADSVGILENLAVMIGFGVKLFHTTSALLIEREKSSAQQEEKQRALQLLGVISDSSRDAIFAKDRAGRYLFANRETIRQTGKLPEDVIGRTDQEIYSPELAGDLVARDDLIIEQSDSIAFEEELTTVDGKRTFLTTKGPLKDADGNVYGIYGISCDITDREHALIALKRSEQHLKQAQAIAHIGSWTYDMTGHAIWSDELYRIFGVSPDSFTPDIKAFISLIHPDDQAAIHAWISSCIAAKNPDAVEFRCIRSDGTVRYINGQGELIVDAEGKFLRLSGTVQDITERKQMEDRLRKSEERLALATRAGGIGIWDWDVERNELVWDDYMIELYGLAREEFSASYEAWQQCLHQDDRERIKQAVNDALMDIRPFDIEFRAVRAEGSIRHIKAYAQVFRDVRGKPLRMVGVNWDITTQKHVEAQLFKSMQQLEVKELAKTRFLAAAGHDLRQPLTAANMFINALKFAALTPKQNTLIQSLERSMTTFSGLLDALLNVSKLDAGRVKPEYNAIDVSKLIIWLEENLEPMARDKKIAFKLYFPMKQKLFVRSDIGLVKSVLMNLVSNAIKFTSEGAILISARPRGGDVLFQVWDTGIGMQQECIAYIFDEFYQANNPHRDRNSGLGLGLSIVKRSLALLEREIRCRSTPGRGTVFEFLLPAAPLVLRRPGATLELQENVPDSLFAIGKRFIVVEDDMLVAQATAACLEEIGGTVQCFHSAEIALHHVSVEHADYYIVDYMLAGQINGIQFLNQLRQKLARPVNAVLVTGDTSSKFISSAADFEWPVLFKPVNVSELLASLSAQESQARLTDRCAANRRIA